MDLITYKKALLKYQPIETMTAGLELVGSEVKSLRAKLGSLEGSRVVVRGGEGVDQQVEADQPGRGAEIEQEVGQSGDQGHARPAVSPAPIVARAASGSPQCAATRCSTPQSP